MSKIFISHSSKDNAKALAVAQWLEQNGWADYFLDIDPRPVRGLLPGERWQEALKIATDRCEVVLFLISPTWSQSKWCQDEFMYAKRLGKTIFGAIIAPTPLESLPLEMREEWQLCNLIDGMEQQKFRVFRDPIVLPTDVSLAGIGLASLKQGLQKAGLDPSTFPYDKSRPPYRGLKALEAEDASVFFGREAPLIRALDSLRRMTGEGEHLFVILGASGAGKSSFLRAGLWPRLKRDDRHFLPLPIIRPERAAISGQTGLLASLEQTFGEYKLLQTRGALSEALRKPEGLAKLIVELQTVAQKMLGPGSIQPTVVISVDQAEELFRPDAGEEGSQLLDQLSALISQPQTEQPGRLLLVPRVMVIAAIRSDSYERLQMRPTIARVRQTTFSLPPLAPAEFKMVIEGPATRAMAAGRKLVIEPSLTEQLLKDAEGADALPLLAFVLEKLLIAYGGDGDLLLREYKAMGGLQGSIEAAVNEALKDPGRVPLIPADEAMQRALLHQAFPALVTLDQDSEKPKRLVATWSTLPGEVHPLLERLVEARLLIKDRRTLADGQQVIVVEVTHEALLRQWSILTTWLKMEGVNVKVTDSVRRAAAEWRKAQRTLKPELESWLIHGGEALADAERLVGRRDYASRFGIDEREYLAACRAKVQAARAERVAQLARMAKVQRRAKVLLWIIAWILLGTGIWIVGMARELQKQTSRVLVSDARFVGDRGWYDQAVRLDVLAMRNTGLLDQEERRAVETELARLSYVSPQVGQMNRSGGLIEMVAAFNPDQHQAVTASGTAAWVWDVATGGVHATLKHEDKVVAATFSPDGRLVATASEDKTARVWSIATGTVPVVLQHGEKVESVMFSPDGRQVVTVSGAAAWVWDVATGTLRGSLKHDDKVVAATFSPNGQQVVTVSWDQQARIWEVSTQRNTATLRHNDRVWVATFSPDGRQVVTVSEDKTARVWDVATGIELAVLQHREEVESAKFSPDGRQVVTTSGMAAWVWDVLTGTLHVELRHDDKVVGAIFSPDGRQVVTVSLDQAVRVWDVATRAAGATLHHNDKVIAAIFSQDGRQVITASQHHTVRVWDLGKMEEGLEHDDKVKALTFSPDGRKVVTASADRSACVWDVETGRLLVKLPHNDWVVAATFSPDGRQVVTASFDSTSRVWDVQTGKALVTFGHGDKVVAAAFSPDGQKVITTSTDKTARVWDVATGKELVNLHHDAVVATAAFSQDGQRLLTVSWDDDNTVQVREHETKQPLATLRHDEKVVAAMFSKNGQVVLTASDSVARVWDIETGDSPKTLPHDDKVVAATFSPDGHQVATASDTVAQVWEVETRRVLAILHHDDKVKAVTFSPDGRQLVTASSDKTTRVWDVETGMVLAMLRHDEKVVAAVFSPDGRKVATASEDKVARVWDIQWLTRYSGEELIEKACREKLNGARLVTESDVEISPVLRGRVGEDVCAPQGWFTRFFF